MGNHSNAQLNQHIQSNNTLLEKMNGLTTQLQTNLLQSFEATTGVPLPSAVEAIVRQVQWDMIYSSDPIIDEYMSGAKTLLDAAFTGNEVDIADKALDVVQVLLNNVVGTSTIQTGGSNQSEHLQSQSGQSYVCAAFTEVQECSAQDWLTQSNFYTAYYAYVVWQPPAEQLTAIRQRLASR